MDLKPNAFGRRSLLWAAVAVLLAGIGSCIFTVLGLYYLAPLAAAAFAVGGLHGLLGLWWDDARACAAAALVLNLVGLAAAVWLYLWLPTSGWGC